MSSLPADYQPPSADSLPKGPSATALQATREYALSHTMYRIKDPRVSIPFYTETLGMSLISRSDSQGGKFTNYFLLYPQSPVPEDEEAKKSWLWSQQGIIELCHNWGTENDPTFEHCSGNEKEHKGFGHVAILVDDLQVAVKRFTDLGVKFKKRPEEGSMRHIAFILDPDGYWIEVLKKGGKD